MSTWSNFFGERCPGFNSSCCSYFRDQICSVQRSIHFPSVGGKFTGIALVWVAFTNVVGVVVFLCLLLVCLEHTHPCIRNIFWIVSFIYIYIPESQLFNFNFKYVSLMLQPWMGVHAQLVMIWIILVHRKMTVIQWLWFSWAVVEVQSLFLKCSWAYLATLKEEYNLHRHTRLWTRWFLFIDRWRWALHG